MNRKLLVVLLFLVTSSANAELGEKRVETAGGFSLRAPVGWQFREFPGLKYQVAFGVPENAFSPNINVVDEPYSGSLKSYVDGNVDVLKRMLPQFQLAQRGKFVTTSGLAGEKIVGTSVQQNNRLRQSFYFIPGSGGRYFVVTCSALAEGGESRDAQFDESIKSFALIK